MVANRCDQRIPEFFNNSTIHGVKELADSETSAIVKVVWFGILSSCIVGLYLASARTVQDFSDGITRATIKKPTDKSKIEIPEIVICPAVFASSEKLRRYGMEKRQLNELLMQLLQYQMYHPTIYLYLYNSGITYDIGKQELDVFMVQNNFSDMDHVINAITTSPKQFFSDDSLHYFYVSTVLKSLGPCFLFQYKNINFLALLYGQAMIKIQQAPMSQYFPAFLRNELIMFIGRGSKSAIPYNPVQLLPGQSINLEIEAQYINYKSTKINACKGVIEMQHECIFRCYGDVYCNCELYQPGKRINETVPYCSAFSPYHMNTTKCGVTDMNKAQLECEKRCPEPCLKDIIRKSITYGESLEVDNDSMVAPTHIRISCVDPTSWITIEETFAYTPWDLFGTLGGQISLWCGASIMSICQVLYYCVFKRCRSILKKEKNINFTLDKKMKRKLQKY